MYKNTKLISVSAKGQREKPGGQDATPLNRLT